MLIPSSKLQQVTRLRTRSGLKRPPQLVNLRRYRGARGTSRRGTAFDALLPGSELGEGGSQRGMDLDRDLGRDFVECDAGLFRRTNQSANQSVTLTKWHARFDEQICKIGGSHRGIERRRHALDVHSERVDR